MRRFQDIPLDVILEILDILFAQDLTSYLRFTSVTRLLRRCIHIHPVAYKHVYCPVGRHGETFQSFVDTFTRNRSLAERVTRLTIVGVGVSRAELWYSDLGRYPRIDYDTFRRLVRLFGNLHTLDGVALQWVRSGTWKTVTGVKGRLPSGIREVNLIGIEASETNLHDFIRCFNMFQSATTVRLSTYHDLCFETRPSPVPLVVGRSNVSEMHLDLGVPWHSSLVFMSDCDRLKHLLVHEARPTDCALLNHLISSSCATLETFELHIAYPTRRKLPLLPETMLSNVPQDSYLQDLGSSCPCHSASRSERSPLRFPVSPQPYR